MKVLITAGSTQVPIDQVRCVSNIFGGRTGADIARAFARHSNSWAITLLSSGSFPDAIANVRLVRYKTFDQLAERMEQEIVHGGYDVVIHSAAVSDFRVARTLVMVDGQLTPIDSSGKIGSNHDRLFLEMVPTYKIVDKIRADWGFTGKLVKFKLQVNMPNDQLITIARQSRTASQADLIVANCLEWAREYAYIIGPDERPMRVERIDLGQALIRRLL